MIKERDKRRGFTDRLYLFNLRFICLITALTFLVVLFSGLLEINDLSPISALITSAYAELGIHTGFIIWKAKNENISKFNNINTEEI